MAGAARHIPSRGNRLLVADKCQADGSVGRMYDDLRDRIRGAAGRDPGLTAAIIDSQSVKGSEMISRGYRGYDAGKKINGTKRHIAVDVMSLLLTVLVTAASVQDCDAARPLLWNCVRPSPRPGSPEPTAAMPASWSPGPRPRSSSPSRSSGGPMTCTPSESCLAGGSSSGPGPGDHPAPPHRPGLRAAGRPPRGLYLLGHDHRNDAPPRPPGRSCQHLSTSSLRCCPSLKQALRPALPRYP